MSDWKLRPFSIRLETSFALIVPLDSELSVWTVTVSASTVTSKFALPTWSLTSTVRRSPGSRWMFRINVQVKPSFKIFAV